MATIDSQIAAAQRELEKLKAKKVIEVNTDCQMLADDFLNTLNEKFAKDKNKAFKIRLVVKILKEKTTIKRK